MAAGETACGRFSAWSEAPKAYDRLFRVSLNELQTIKMLELSQNLSDAVPVCARAKRSGGRNACRRHPEPAARAIPLHCLRASRGISRCWMKPLKYNCLLGDFRSLGVQEKARVILAGEGEWKRRVGDPQTGERES